MPNKLSTLNNFEVKHICLTVGTITLQSDAHNYKHFTAAFCSIHRPEEYGDITLL
jgi:hypothetical protein